MPKVNESKRPSHLENEHHEKAGTFDNSVHEVEFVLECNGAQQVYVCGDFNDWQPISLRMIGIPDVGLWEKRLPLAPGRYEYKYFVDGKWAHDPDAVENVPNIYGTLNSILEVRL